MDKQVSRIRRGKRARMKMRELRVNRLSVHRTSLHIYAQVVTADGSQVLASASSLDKDLRASLDYTGNVEAAAAVGKLVAERALAKGIDSVAFDRSGFKYHGRIKALADGAREAGLKF
ncbi:MAG TPA: 50S ribosomal protein L18 [Candidatus Thiothrix moscowensis]|uniref:50S ribosomal protein L18 n=1 Tax=unclassified Thiothrix TaxID=2636184 RepID=UPI0025F70DEB|nr:MULTISPECIES: 50S ribosomal protein L18 [unclassified Thiothrix]HRJ51187.1 50S ribosomal protein L18 [Candidatus Thiothrix moscowensis]HRJ91758.1 50S ribosomal protein L18 [Candidatus Thiothrix moscowensis]